MRILIVEDELRLVEQMVAVFQADGHLVDSHQSGEDGLRHALAGQCDLVVLDIGLPDRDGWAVLGELRRQGVPTPVLMLTEQGQVDARVRGFELGADDYLPKPFDFRELLARVRAIGSRSGRLGGRVTAGDLALDLDTRRASRGGKPLTLSPHEFVALLLLVRKRGEVVTREEISEQVLERKHLGNSNAVEVLIRRLRLKVNAGFRGELIRTVRGRGYTFALPPAATA